MVFTSGGLRFESRPKTNFSNSNLSFLASDGSDPIRLGTLDAKKKAKDGEDPPPHVEYITPPRLWNLYKGDRAQGL